MSQQKKVSYPRSLAVRVLTRVLSDHEALDEAIAAVSGELAPASLGWLQDVCSGTLRWKGRLDAVLDSIALKKKPSGWLRKVLLLASYQLIVQDRTHAALVVSETVSEVKAKEGNAPAQFANACLRKVAEHALQWRSQAFQAKQGIKEGASWASLPEWLWKRILAQYGEEWACAYAQASLERPKLWVRSKPGDWTPSWGVAGPVKDSWQAIEGGSVVSKAGFLEGDFLVQDISSQFLIDEVTRKVHAIRGADLQGSVLQALDLCAAPGGKSVGLAWSGFQVTATDRVSARLPLLRQTVARAAPSIRVISWEELGSVGSKDLIWVDAPCSGTGILRRHPDVRWLRQEKELAGLIASQRELLKNAWEKVPAGGFLVYSVCSILQEEGPKAIEETQLQGFMISHWFLCPQNAPHGDGFWACLLQKEAP